MKNNKLKNTGLIFELLCRNITHETLNSDKPQNAIKIVKKYFNPKSYILAELKLYHSLSDSNIKDVNVNELVQLVIEHRNKLDLNRLSSEKYQLIREIKSKYNLEEFFHPKISNYRIYGSIYNLFQQTTPEEILTAKQIIVEHIEGKNKVAEKTEIQNKLDNNDSDVKKIGFKIIVERFNQKYRNLSDRQKKLLSKYINEEPSSSAFKDYVFGEVKYIRKKLGVLSEKVDSVLKIKIYEGSNLLDTILTSSILKEEYLTSLLKYYELIQKLEKK